MTNHMKAKEFLVGAAVGGIIGSLSALLMAPKSGKRFRKDINNMCCDWADQAHDMADEVSRKGKSLVKNLGSEPVDWADKAKCLFCGVKDFFGFKEKDEDDDSDSDHDGAIRDLLIGSAIGGILGAAAGLVLAPKSGNKLREDISDAYEDFSEKAHDLADKFARNRKGFSRNKAGKWLNAAKNFVEEMSDKVQEKGEEISEGGHNLMEWASLGYRIWQGLNKRR